MKSIISDVQEILKDIKFIKEMTYDYIKGLFIIKNKIMAVLFTLLLIVCINTGIILCILILK